MVKIDESKCDGYASCVLLAPDVFGFDDERNVAVVIPSSESMDPDVVEEAIVNCPRRAISH